MKYLHAEKVLVVKNRKLTVKIILLLHKYIYSHNCLNPLSNVLKAIFKQLVMYESWDSRAV